MVHIFIGTKAQLIKMAPVMQELQRQEVHYNFIFSGQHKDKISELIDEYGLKVPDHTLYDGPDITSILAMAIWSMRVSWAAIRKRDEIFSPIRAGILVSHGDTVSALVGSVVGKTLGLRTAHVESGLTSSDIFHPFPEEVIRRLIFCVTDIYYCPGQWALKNLSRFSGVKVNTFSNTLLDSINQKKDMSVDDIFPDYPYALVSLHRYENIFSKRRLQLIVEQLISASKKVRLLIILHKPTVRRLIEGGFMGQIKESQRIETRPRYNHSDFISLVKRAEFVITDGGSNQEECFYLGVPCLVMRKRTERMEGLGDNVVLSKYSDSILQDFISRYPEYKRARLSNSDNPSKLIVKSLLELDNRSTQHGVS